MTFPEELKIEAAEAYRQNILVPGIEHVNRNDWMDAWCCGITYQIKKQQEEGKEVFNDWWETYQSEHPGDFDVDNGADTIALGAIAEVAFEAGYKAKEAEPLPPIVQGLIDGQKKINDQLREVVIWRVDEPPKNKKIELLCVLFDEDEYRTLKKNEWSDGYNRFIVTGTWNGSYFRGKINHASDDPFPKVVAWRPMEEPNLGAPFYTKCLGECRD